MNSCIPVRDKTRNSPVLSAHNFSEDYELKALTKILIISASLMAKRLQKINSLALRGARTLRDKKNLTRP
jgi:3-dehydroquinate dehydratase